MYYDFVGRSERRVDPKGRVALPADFRMQLEPRCFVTQGPGCLHVHPKENWTEVAQDMVTKQRNGEITEEQRRRFSESAAVVALDAQNRVTLSKELLDHAGIEPGSDVVIIGNLVHLEIWNPARRAA